MKALVGAFNQEKALVGAFSVIVQLHRLIDLRRYSTCTPHHLGEGRGCRSEGEGGGQGGGVAPGEVVVVGVEEVVPPPAVAGEHLARGG